MIESLVSNFSNRSLLNFVRIQNSSFVEYNENLSDIVSDFEKFDNLIKVGEIEYENTDVLLVFTCEYLGELTSRSAKKAQYEIAKKVLKEDFKDGAVFVFYDETGNFRFSFIRKNYGNKEQKYTNWKRYTYFVEPDAKTNRTFIERVGTCKFDSLDAIQEAFSVDKLTTDFYKELSDWFFWAIKIVKFPNDETDESDDEKYNSENIIRLITRLIFVWFLKQKGLIKSELFDLKFLAEILKNFDAESPIQNNYYRAILQNLFFATLNQEIGKRGFAQDINFNSNRSTNNIKSLYRYENEFVNDTTQIMELFSQVPFLNGGLFECLDRKEKDGKMFDWDGFSRNSKRQAIIPNYLFFANEFKVDLSGEYNDKKKKSEKVSGIIEILNRYNFTIEENTPVEIEVALDPELLGKVFENLLGAYNPETRKTARKQTGSFYTPREIVKYMVDESLIAYFQTKIPDLHEEKLRLLFNYNDEEVEFTDLQRESLIQAAFDCKILDPACGSGAFPMGILQQMVHILKKLDQDNIHWNNVVLTQAMKDYQEADKLSEEDIEQLRNEIEKTFDEGLNYPDYARKLHLIENCIYGVDIQSIAVQISKLRFFISLVCEQKRNTKSSENFGIRPLPNLETKFVAANTLIGLEKTEEDLELFNDDKIKILIDKLQHIRHRQFLVTNTTEKKRLRDKDKKLREDIENEVTQLYKKHKDDNKAFYERQKVLAEKELELMDKTLERSTISPNIFGEQITKTYKPNEKRKNELRKSIEAITIKISVASDFSRLGAVVNLAKQLTSWNPYDQNESSPFFDPEWMFGLPKQDEGYFDVMIGNPPYIGQSGNKEIFRTVKSTTFGVKYHRKRMDYFYFFVHYAIDNLKHNSILSFITTNYFFNATCANVLRDHIKDIMCFQSIVNFNESKIFASAQGQHSTIYNLIKNKNFSNEVNVIFSNEKAVINNEELNLIFNGKHNYFKYFKIKQNNLFEPTTNNINCTSIIESNGVKNSDISYRFSNCLRLVEVCDINQGILTGANSVTKGNVELSNGVVKIGEGIYILTDDELYSLQLSNREMSNIKPWYKNSNIKQYVTTKPNPFWLIYAKLNSDIENIKGIYNHLEKFEEIIKDRNFESGELSKAKRLNKWWALSSARTDFNFSQPKIVCPQRSPKNTFAYVDEEWYAASDVYYITNKKNVNVSLKYILAILNSNLIFYWLYNKGQRKGDILQLFKGPLKEIPIKIGGAELQLHIETLTNEIILKKEENYCSNTKIIEHKIDNLVYCLYNLTYAEIKVIEPDIESRISEVEYNAITLE